MSYILDALRKADAERERGAVPGLNAQAMPPHPDDAAPARRAGRLPWVIAALSALLSLAVLAWFTLGREAPPSPAPPVAAAGPDRTTPPARVPDERRPPPDATAAPEPLPAAVPPPRVAAPVARQPASEAQAAAGGTKPDPKARAAAGSPSAPADPAASQAVATVVPLRELPDEVRRQIPALAVGGSMYSKDAASRMLIVNGQVLHEGDEVAPGLKLEQIRLKAAVLRFRQHRFEITY